MSSTTTRSRTRRWVAALAGIALLPAPWLASPAQAATATISGVVSTKSQAAPTPVPLEGATVQLLNADADSSEEALVGTQVTLADGAYQFANVPQGARYYVKFSKGSAYARAQTAIFKLSADAVRNTTLAKSASVTGRVLDPDNRPVSKANVWLVAGGTEHMRVTTNSAGEFTINQFEPGTYEVFIWFTSGSLRDQLVRHGGSSLIPMGDEAPVNLGDIKLSRGGSMTGRVRNASGKPVSKVEVTVERQGNGPVEWSHRTVMTNSSGKWTAQGLPAGRYTVHLRGPDRYLPSVVRTKNGQRAARIPVAEGEKVTVRDIRLYRSAKAQVTVRDPQGKRLADVWIQVREVRGGKVYSKNVGSISSHERGIYDISGLQHGRKYMLRIIDESGRHNPISSKRFVANAHKVTVVRIPRFSRVAKVIPKVSVDATSEGSTVTMRVRARSSARTLSGTVRVFSGSREIARERLLSRKATLTLTNQKPGTRSYSVKYSGDWFNKSVTVRGIKVRVRG
jgi:5-hydroxyisourate hydrolase-like protein (transthyretin family)